MYNASWRGSLDSKVSTATRSGDTFLIVMPRRITSGGSCGSASFSRFCVCTVAISTLAPISNVSLIVTCPSFVLVES